MQREVVQVTQLRRGPACGCCWVRRAASLLHVHGCQSFRSPPFSDTSTRHYATRYTHSMQRVAT